MTDHIVMTKKRRSDDQNSVLKHPDIICTRRRNSAKPDMSRRILINRTKRHNLAIRITPKPSAWVPTKATTYSTISAMIVAKSMRFILPLKNPLPPTAIRAMISTRKTAKQTSIPLETHAAGSPSPVSGKSARASLSRIIRMKLKNTSAERTPSTQLLRRNLCKLCCTRLRFACSSSEDTNGMTKWPVPPDIFRSDLVELRTGRSRVLFVGEPG
mmetsp:Transcript_35542/g.102380  ORF Transcript_35542/g.102380 Transcript_35542/m.102380 type:complete len:214 (-) Transcript_35542:161-802(-)